MNLVLIVSSVLLNAAAQLFLKKGMLLIGYIVAAFVGWAVLGESMSLTKVAGIAVICLGIVLLYRS